MPTAWCRVNSLSIFAITIILKFATLSDFAPHLTAPRFSCHGFLSFSLLLSLSRELLKLPPPSFPCHYTLSWQVLHSHSFYLYCFRLVSFWTSRDIFSSA